MERFNFKSFNFKSFSTQTTTSGRSRLAATSSFETAVNGIKKAEMADICK